MTKKTIRRDYKAMIGDLEAQIDYLVGYTAVGNWKQNFAYREKLIAETLDSDLIPQETRDKIIKIQDAIYKLRNGLKEDQNYLYHQSYDIKQPILVNDNMKGKKYLIYPNGEKEPA